uniref:GBS Bsp-like repeat-containing protein n=1 Tax=Paenibacillus sp. KS-LC4 TaxID=2979727 RepID=UPI00403F291D
MSSITTVKETTFRILDKISLTEGGYEVYVDGVGDKVRKVLFPTWTSQNGQDDLFWHEGDREHGRYGFRSVNIIMRRAAILHMYMPMMVQTIELELRMVQ